MIIYSCSQSLSGQAIVVLVLILMVTGLASGQDRIEESANLRNADENPWFRGELDLKEIPGFQDLPELPIIHDPLVRTTIDFHPKTDIKLTTDINLAADPEPATLRSTGTGGVWDDAATWDAGRVPTRYDTVIVASGTLVSLSGNNQRATGRLVIEEGGELRGLDNARLAIYMDFLNDGELTHEFDSDQFFVGVLGRIVNHGSIRTNEAEFDVQLINLQTYNTIVNHGEWMGRIDVNGDLPRTIDLRNADDAIVTINMTELILLDDNYLPNYLSFGGGAKIVVPSSARLFSEIFSTLYYEYQGVLDNRGQIILQKKDTIFEGFGMSIMPSDSIHARVISYGKQVPPGFALANRRWYRLEPVEEPEDVDFIDLTLWFAVTDLMGNLPEALEIFWSPDGGISWEQVSNDDNRSRNLFAIDFNGLGSVSMADPPGYGDYALSVADPHAVRPVIGLHITTAKQIRVGGPPHEAILTYYNPGLVPLGKGLIEINTGGGVYIDHIIPMDQNGAELEGNRMEIDDFAFERDSTEALLVTPELEPNQVREVRLILQAIPVNEDPVFDQIAALPAFLGAAIVVGMGKDYFKNVVSNGLEEVVADPCGNKSTFQQKMNTAFQKTDEQWNPFSRSEAPYKSVATNSATELTSGGPNILKSGLSGFNVYNDVKDIGNALTRGGTRYEQNYGRTVFDRIDCDPEPKPPYPSPDSRSINRDFDPVQSWDPNQKVGPFGAGSGEFLSEVGKFNYRIDFENLEEATAPAWSVVIVDTLASVFDPESVKLQGESHPGFEFTRTDNVLRWEIEGIELPPNITPPEGEGWVAFIVDAVPGLESGTVFENKATITFDLNPPIVTNTHVNILDNLAPVTEMQQLPGTVVTDTLTVSFNANDGLNGSGVDNVVVFGSRNGEGFTQLAVTESDHARVPVTSGTWNFYALATDVVGNAEIMQPAVVTTTVVTPVSLEENAELPFVWDLGSNYPNPFNPVTVIPYSLQSGGEVTFRIYDVLGRTVQAIAPGFQTAGRYFQEMDMRRMASGTYFYELQVRSAGSVLFRETGKMMLLK